MGNLCKGFCEGIWSILKDVCIDCKNILADSPKMSQGESYASKKKQIHSLKSRKDKSQTKEASKTKCSFPSKVEEDKDSISKEHKKSKDASEETVDGTISSNEISWERVIDIFDMESPDIKVILEAWRTAVRLSRQACEEKAALENQSIIVWHTQQEARDIKEKLLLKKNEAKSEWKKLEEKSDKYNGEKYEVAADEACVNYKKIKKDMKTAERIAKETLVSYIELQNTIVEKEKKYNQQVRKVNASLARLIELEKRSLTMVEKSISEDAAILQQATQYKNSQRKKMEEAVIAAEEAKQKFIKMEGKMRCANQEYDEEVKKICCCEKKMNELSKMTELREVKESEMDLEPCRVDIYSKVETNYEED